MSALAAVALVGAMHGAGVYGEAGYDVAWSDRIGFVTRGDRFLGEVGYFTGRFQGSYGFGDFWKFGLGLAWEPIILRGARASTSESDKDVFVGQFFNPQLTLAHGANLFRLGFWWRVRLGPVWSTDKYDLFFSKDAIWGGSVTGEVGVGYNFTPSITLGPRFSLGLLVDEIRTAYQVTAGFGFSFQIPLRNVSAKDKADYWESDYK